jgi:hypothetical protein
MYIHALIKPMIKLLRLTGNADGSSLPCKVVHNLAIHFPIKSVAQGCMLNKTKTYVKKGEERKSKSVHFGNKSKGSKFSLQMSFIE